jgi:hypothetical protein
MKKENRILLGAVCLAALLAIGAAGMATAAIVPFNGIESSWLHSDSKGLPAGDWVSQISDNIPVRKGDAMQFQNRYYNNYAGTADLRISYGGEIAGICTGADESVYYGLNYGNYYPSGQGSRPAHSTVLNRSTDLRYLMVTHQYVFNGILYGTMDPPDKTLLFQWRADINDSRVIQTSPTPAPSGTARPTNTNTSTGTGKPTLVPPPSAMSSPGLDISTLIALVSALAIAYGLCGIARKR